MCLEFIFQFLQTSMKNMFEFFFKNLSRICFWKFLKDVKLAFKRIFLNIIAKSLNFE
jgi:hypothetical protein